MYFDKPWIRYLISVINKAVIIEISLLHYVVYSCIYVLLETFTGRKLWKTDTSIPGDHIEEISISQQSTITSLFHLFSN